MRRAAWRWALAGAVVVVPACKTAGGASSPERLVAAHQQALIKDDPQAAYALLSPEAQAKTPYDAFAARWRADAAERSATVEAAREMPPDQRGVTRSGSTVHPGGHVLQWTEVGGRYVVTAGLPGRPQAATPAQAIRSFIAAVRRADLDEVRGLLTDELASALEEDWQARVDAIEAALEEPGTLELSGDFQRAALRYEPQHAVTLRQTPAGWRIMSLQ